MLTRKEIAQFFRLGLRFRLADLGAVERWVDSIIAAEPIVSFPFTDLAGASKLNPGSVEDLLGQVTGPGEVYLPGRVVLALLRRHLRASELTPEAAIKFALQAGRAGELSEAECNKADGLDDSVWLATNDTYGTLDEIRRDITEFFENYADYDERIPTLA